MKAERLRTVTWQVKRVQYGSGGYRETPRGLILENFVTHANVRNRADNRLPKVGILHRTDTSKYHSPNVAYDRLPQLPKV